jgi:3',5'-nucleoside bisphosphate phosphatase
MPQHRPPLTLAPDAAIDLQLHTTFSDGNWTAEALLDHVAAAGFALVAVTDHDRVDTVAEVQRLGAARGVPVLAAAELSATWEGQMLDLLCYGFDPLAQHPLATLAATTRQSQLANLRETYAELQRRGYRFPDTAEPRHLGDLIALMEQGGYAIGLGDAVRGAGFRWIMADPAAVVDAAHRSDALCLIGHPGRGEGFVRLDTPQLDRLRAIAPFDGLEVEHPTHTPEQSAHFLAYAQRHNLLISTGSDSHGPPGHLPIPYRAETSRALLEHLGIQIG